MLSRIADFIAQAFRGVEFGSTTGECFKSQVGGSYPTPRTNASMPIIICRRSSVIVRPSVELIDTETTEHRIKVKI